QSPKPRAQTPKSSRTPTTSNERISLRDPLRLCMRSDHQSHPSHPSHQQVMRNLRQGRASRLVIVIAYGIGMAQFFALALASLTLGLQTQTPPEAPQPFVTKQDIADTIRLAATPKIDGTIDAEEWDPLYQ